MVSTKSRYALRALCILALEEHKGNKSIAEISKDQLLPVKYLEQIFFRLKKAGIINSYRGKNGGYTLQRPAGEITILQVIHAVEDSFEPTPCLQKDYDRASCKVVDCYTKPLWEELYQSTVNILENRTIKDLISHS